MPAGAWRTIIAIAVLTILVLASASYYFLIHLPEQARKPYKEAGLTHEQAEVFIMRHPSQNGNSTWVSFAKAWVENPELADSVFSVFKDLSKALNYLSLSKNRQLLSSALQAYGSRASEFVSFVEANDYDGLGFLRELSQLKEKYREVLPAYSSNSTLVKTVWDQVYRDNSVRDKVEVAVKTFSVVYDSGIKSLDPSIRWIPG